MSLRFLTELYSPYDTDDGLLCEVRCLSAGNDPAIRFFGISRLDRAAEYAKAQTGTYDVYMGVLPRFQKTGVAGLDRDVNCAGWLWCDVDRGDATHEQMTDFLPHIKSRLPHPRMIVLSGSGGIHLYWKLIEVTRLNDDSRKDFSALLRRVVAAVGDGPGGVHADKSCTNPSRILRLPKTLNHKHDPPRPVEAVICDKYDLLTLADWDEILPFEPLPARMVRPKFTTEKARANGIPSGLLAWAERGYPEGNRHHDLVGAAAWLRRDTDLPDDVAYGLFVTKAQMSAGRRIITDQEIESAWNWAA